MHLNCRLLHRRRVFNIEQCFHRLIDLLVKMGDFLNQNGNFDFLQPGFLFTIDFGFAGLPF